MDGPGRPTLYRPEFTEQACTLCLVGATSQDLADQFEVARRRSDDRQQKRPAAMAAGSMPLSRRQTALSGRYGAQKFDRVS